MNVLMIGGANGLMNQLIRKIKKEGHRVYLLTGSRYNTAVYEKVFEKYDLPYDSEHLSDVFESVNPDVTLFMGAFDSNFRWANEERELVRMTSSLTNLLTSHTMTGKGRFIFLSSDEVYAQSSLSDIEEDTPASPARLKGMALAQCEDICASFRKTLKASVLVLRIDHLYTIPTNPDEVNDVCSRMCLEALKTGTIVADSGKHFSLLYDADAVEFIYKLIRNGEPKHHVYNLSSSRELSAMDVAQYIQQAMVDDAGITIQIKQGEHSRRVLSNRRFDTEFGARIFADTRETIANLVRYMVAHKNYFLTGEPERKSLLGRLVDGIRSLGGAIIPYLENLALLGVIILISKSALGVEYLQELDLFLLYVLLFAVAYGQQQATFSAILAVIGSHLIQLQDRSFLNIAMDYNTYIWIAQLFVVGLVVGYLKDQINKLNLESEEERRYMDRQLSDITDINSSNIRVKDALETEIVNQRDSIGKIYQITAGLEQYMPEEVLFRAAEIMQELLGSDDIAIYTVSNRSYARLFVFTSELAKSLGKSLRYRELGEVYDAMAAQKVYINRNLDSQYPMMANAIFDGDDMQTMIMVWGLPWERMTLGQADMLTIVSRLIQNAVLRATRYIAMLEDQRYQDDGRVMEKAAFTSLVHIFLDARNKQLTDCALLRIDLPKVEQVVHEEPIQIPVETTDAIPMEDSKQDEKTSKLSALFNKLIHAGRSREETSAPEAVPDTPEEVEVFETTETWQPSQIRGLVSLIRQDDYVGTLEDGNLYILLSNSSNTDAEFVVKRITDAGYPCALMEDFSL